MKLTLTKTQQARFQELLDDAKASRSAQAKENAGYSALVTRKQELADKIDDLEMAEPSDKAARLALTDARTELGMIEQKLTAETARLSAKAFQGKSSVANIQILKDIAWEVQQFGKPTMENYLETLTKPVRPICSSDSEARGIAFNCSAYGSLCRVFHRDFGNVGRTHLGVLDEAIVVLEQILSGEIPWRFDPKL